MLYVQWIFHPDLAGYMMKENYMKFFAFKNIFKTIALALAFWGMSSSASGMAAEFVNINNDGVNLRSGPDTTYEILYELPLGYPLKVISRKGKWLKVSDFENDRGWVSSSLVSKNDYVIVKVAEANVRNGAGTKYKKIGSVVREVILKKIDRRADWVKVQHPQLTGWLHKKLIWP